MLSLVRLRIAARLQLASRWPLVAACGVGLALLLCYQAELKANVTKTSGRFQMRQADGYGYIGFDTATGLDCITRDPRNESSLYRLSTSIPFCVDLLNDRTLAARMQQRLPY